MIGDIDTTASLLSFTWSAIAKKPDVLENSRVENDDLSGEKPSFPALQDMRYLKALLDECRLTMTLLTLLETAGQLYSATPMLAYMTSTDTVLPVGGGQEGKSPLLAQKGKMVG